MKIVQDLINGVKGFLMGAANVVPGVSGGTMALISGIYGRLIDSLNAIMSISTWKSLGKGGFKSFWKAIDGEFLLSIAIGVVLSIFSLAKLMTYCLDYHPIQTWAMFFGLIVASAIYMLIDIKGWKWTDVLFVIAGIAMGVAVCTLTPKQTPDDLWFIAICGAIAICTMILPGISGSFILVILSKYDYIMQAVSSLNWPVLIVFAIGCVVGICAFAKCLHYLMARAEKQTMLVLVGFVIGSLVKVWPWADPIAIEAAQLKRTIIAAPIDMQYTSAIIWMVLGALLIVLIETLGQKGQRQINK